MTTFSQPETGCYSCFFNIALLLIKVLPLPHASTHEVIDIIISSKGERKKREERVIPLIP